MATVASATVLRHSRSSLGDLNGAFTLAFYNAAARDATGTNASPPLLSASRTIVSL